MWERGLCGSWLACDSITSMQLKNRGACIAGKPAPTLARSHIFFVTVLNIWDENLYIEIFQMMGL
ncbi:hypothetical protein PFLUOLIPICF7_15205 [Pseudomonas simiae]|nr:hypothetical protein PFLUOLIPICF7_15205 [Pseudomonas simiae]